MSEMTKFTQPDVAPDFFIKFLDLLDNLPDIKRIRAESNKRLNLAPGNKVLDLGCGIGGGTFPLAGAVGPTGLAAGIDISASMIESATSRAANRPGVEFKIGDASAIPYADGFFDAARTERLFLYLPDRLGTLHEMKRVLKPGGGLCLIDTDIDSTALYSNKPALTRKMTSIVAASMPNPNSGRELPALARQAGLKNIQIDIFGASTPHEFFLLAIAAALSKAADSGTVPRSELDEFLTEQESLNATGNFFQMWHFVVVTATV